MATRVFIFFRLFAQRRISSARKRDFSPTRRIARNSIDALTMANRANWPSTSLNADPAPHSRRKQKLAYIQLIPVIRIVPPNTMKSTAIRKMRIKIGIRMKTKARTIMKINRRHHHQRKRRPRQQQPRQQRHRHHHRRAPNAPKVICILTACRR